MEKFPEAKATGKPDAETISSWSYDMEGHVKKCVEGYCELANVTTQQTKSQRHAWDDQSILRRNVSLLTKCYEMSVFGSYWET